MNKLKARLKSGKACVNAWLAIPSGFSAEVMAQCGFDSVTVDMQHGVQDYHVDGAMLPGDGQISDHADGAHSVERARHHRQGARRRRLGRDLPDGQHAGGGEGAGQRLPLSAARQAQQRPDSRRRLWRGSPYQSIANDEVLVMPMIETQEAIDNLDAILDVPGISGIYVGPSDLGFSLGLKPMLDREEPQILAIYDKMLKATGKRGLFAGIHNATGAYAARMITMGFRFVTLFNDSGLMARAARAEIATTRKTAGDVAS